MKTVLLAIISTLPLFIKAQGSSNDSAANGLKQYIFVMYTKGSSRTHDSATAAQIQVSHLHHLDSLYHAGLLNVAGPFMEEGDWRGILIFDVKTKEEAEACVKKDPAVMAGRLNYIIMPWMTQKGNCFK